MSGHYWTVSHGLRISVGSGRGAREGIWWRKRGPGDGDGDLELGSLVEEKRPWYLPVVFCLVWHSLVKGKEALALSDRKLCSNGAASVQFRETWRRPVGIKLLTPP